MKYFFTELLTRNAVLYYFGWVCVAGTVLTALLWMTTSVQINNINAWIKPFKFFLSSAIIMWTLAWYIGYLAPSKGIDGFVWVTVVVFVFEVGYISLKASQGQLSHFNISTSLNAVLFSLMGIAISIFTLYTAYIGWLFFTTDFPQLPIQYVWAIRLGIVLFVIFAFEGGLMGAKLSHTIGAADGTPGLPLLNWSVTHGDLRVAHFIGMHALQMLPLLAFYVVRSTNGVIAVAIVYGMLAFFVLWQAIRGIPLLSNP